MIERWYLTLRDAQGNDWVFHYSGGSFVRIKPWGEADWTNGIQLDYYALKPADVTEKWLNERAAEWIADRDKDVAAGTI